ncbi:MAG: hypothetical protein WBF17_14475 [Phycisphaerae bacterium]
MSVDEEGFESGPIEAGESDFVPAFLARDLEEAEEYCELLSDHDIPARPGVDDGVASEAGGEQRLADRRGLTHGVPVLVPEALLDEASEVIADREEFSEFDEDDEEVEDDDDDELELTSLDADEAFIEDDEDDELADDDDDDDDETTDPDDMEEGDEDLY